MYEWLLRQELNAADLDAWLDQASGGADDDLRAAEKRDLMLAWGGEVSD